jgi:putative oxidoreductase
MACTSVFLPCCASINEAHNSAASRPVTLEDRNVDAGPFEAMCQRQAACAGANDHYSHDGTRGQFVTDLQVKMHLLWNGCEWNVCDFPEEGCCGTGEMDAEEGSHAAIALDMARHSDIFITMRHFEKVAWIGGRALMALLFILAGMAKILNAQPFLEHMTQFGVPTLLLPAVVALELGAGLILLIGWRIRDAAGALAVFCLMTAIIFHHQIGIKAERTLFFKDLAIAGGLLGIAASAAVRARRSS